MRQKKEFFATQLLVEAILLAPAQMAEGANVDSKRLQELNKQFFAAVFPYAEVQQEEEVSKRQEVLKKWVERVAAVQVQEVYQDPSTAIREHRRDMRRAQAQSMKMRYSKLLKQRI